MECNTNLTSNPLDYQGYESLDARIEEWYLLGMDMNERHFTLHHKS